MLERFISREEIHMDCFTQRLKGLLTPSVKICCYRNINKELFSNKSLWNYLMSDGDSEVLSTTCTPRGVTWFKLPTNCLAFALNRLEKK